MCGSNQKKGLIMGLGNKIGIRIGSKTASQQNGDVNWGEYWETRTPSNAGVAITGDSTAVVTWDDAAEASSGLKIYVSSDEGVTRILKATVGFGIEDYINRGNLIYKDNDITALMANSCDPVDESVVIAAKNKLDQAKLKSAGVIIYFHGVTDEDVILLEEIIDYAIGLDFDIVTIDGLYEKITA
jgi:hypothetical protein